MRRYLYTLLFALFATLLPAQTLIRNDWGGKGNARMAKRQANRHGIHFDAYSGRHHLLGVHSDLGYSDYIGAASFTHSAPGGITWGIGADYMYQQDHFFVLSGLALRLQTVKLNVDSWQYEIDMHDSQGAPYRLRYHFYDRKDLSRNLFLEVPVMVGGYLHEGLYLMAGAKFQLRCYSYSRVDAIGSTTAVYQRYVGVWEEMDNHGYRKDVPLRYTDGGLGPRFDITASAEFGYEWMLHEHFVRSGRRSTQDHRLRLGAFVDFGLLRTVAKGVAPLYDIPSATPFDFSTFHMQNAILSSEMTSSSVRNLFVGLKLTYFFYGHEAADSRLMINSRGRIKKLRR